MANYAYDYDDPYDSHSTYNGAVGIDLEGSHGKPGKHSRKRNVVPIAYIPKYDVSIGATEIVKLAYGSGIIM